MVEEMVQTNQAPREPQSIMNPQTLEHLSRELVRLCDNVETHGLVDYQMGVAEEEIMDRKLGFSARICTFGKLTTRIVILRCLSLLDPVGERPGEGGAQAEPTVAAAARSR